MPNNRFAGTPVYRERTGGDVKTQGEVKGMYSNVSFSRVVDTYADLGWDEIVAVPMPAPSTPLKTVEHGDPVEIDGKWTQVWVEEDRFSGATKAADEAAHIEQLDTAAAASARTERDLKLAVTDFHGLTDNTMSAEMTTYRQALRDVPQQGDFPNEIDWPVEPS